MVILAFARRPWGREQWLDEVNGMLKEKFPDGVDQEVLARFCTRLEYFQGNLDNEDSFKKLRETIDSDNKFSNNIAFYMSVRPAEFGSTTAKLGEAGLLEEQHGWRRVVFEKPFGYDLLSAQILQKKLSNYLSEHQIYRIDHYLGKGTVQNVLVFRFANFAHGRHFGTASILIMFRLHTLKQRVLAVVLIIMKARVRYVT